MYDTYCLSAKETHYVLKYHFCLFSNEFFKTINFFTWAIEVRFWQIYAHLLLETNLVNVSIVIMP